MTITKSHLKELIYQVNGAAIEVHKTLGAGLLESVYHKCLKQEFIIRGIEFKSEMLVPILYKGLHLETDLRCDFFIENILVLELKSVELILPIHKAQLLTYMNLLNVPQGLMINFNVNNLFFEGQTSYVNELYRQLPD